jgi:tRNA 2-selenouridine synthase SelU
VHKKLKFILISQLSRDQIFAAWMDMKGQKMGMKGQKTKTFQVYFKVIIMQFAWRIVGGGWRGRWQGNKMGDLMVMALQQKPFRPGSLC